MSARIDGVDWTAGCIFNAATFGGNLQISGTDNNPSGNARAQIISLQVLAGIGVVVTPGTYPIGAPPPPGIGNGSNALLNIGSGCVTPSNACSVWATGQGFDSGTITISTLTAAGASGTFSLLLFPLSGTPATGTKVVTNGLFNVTF